jgi:hypothetical protein
MSRRLATVAPVVSLALAVSVLAGCGAQPNRPVAPMMTSIQSVKAEAASRKLSRAEAEKRAKQLIAEFDDHNWRSINARTEAVRKIARTDADAAYDFLLQEVQGVQDLRDEMKSVTKDQADEYEETLTELIDDMTPDQEAVKQRVAKAKSLNMDLDELTISEERANPSAMALGGTAHVGSRNRLLTAIQESKVYKAISRAYKNTRKKVKNFLNSLCKKIHMC